MNLSTRTRRRVAGAIVTAGVAAAATGAAATSSAAPSCSGTACKDRVGLASAYTRHTVDPSGSAAKCPGDPIDPVNVFWFGRGAYNANGVAAALSAHGWPENDESSVILNLAQILGLTSDIRQAVTDNSFGCTTDTGQRATHNFASQDRLHVRLMVTASPTRPATVHYVVGDAHHDKGIPGGTCKKYSFPGLGTRYQHSSASFNDSRNAIATIWRNMGRTPHFDNWVNTKPLKQCDGQFTQSDGMVAAMPQN